MKDFIGETSGITYSTIKTLGSGGQGTVFLVEDINSKKQYAAKWYKKNLSTPDQLKQIQELVSRGTPKSQDMGIYFIWPIECISSDESDCVGYVMPLIDTSRFYTIHQITDRQVRQPKLNILCKICRHLVTALEQLHSQGLAYCDINVDNIMVDPQSGEIVICDNDNVIVNNTDAPVLGVWDFMAPEVALGDSKPNADSDLYSVAVLLYYLWMWEHPMSGKAFYSLRCHDNIAKKKFFAEQPLFVFDPNDSSNSAEGVDILELHVARWNRMCPNKLKDMFTRVFTEGVKSTHRRPRLSEWQRVFAELESNVLMCQCEALNLWGGDEKSILCFSCQSPLKPSLVIEVDHGHAGKTTIPVAADIEIRNYHLEPGDYQKEGRQILGKIENHPKSPGNYIIRNLTSFQWNFIAPDSSVLTIEAGQARPILPEVNIQFSGKSLSFRN